MGRIARRKQCIEKTIELAFAHVSDIANLHGPMPYLRIRLPQGMTESRKCGSKPFAIDIIVGHREM